MYSIYSERMRWGEPESHIEHVVVWLSPLQKAGDLSEWMLTKSKNSNRISYGILQLNRKYKSFSSTEPSFVHACQNNIAFSTTLISAIFHTITSFLFIHQMCTDFCSKRNVNTCGTWWVSYVGLDTFFQFLFFNLNFISSWKSIFCANFQ